MKKLKILVAVRTSWHLRDFIESKLIDELKKKFEISFFFVDADLSAENLIQEYDVSKYGDIFKYPFNYKKKAISKNIIVRKLKTLKKIFRPKINHFLYFLNEIQNKINYQRKEIVFEAYKYDGPLSAKIVKFLIKFRLDKIVQKILTAYIYSTVPKMIPRDKNFDMILIAYNSFNVYGYMDDLIRDSKKLKIKTFGLQINLDNLIDRVPLEKTDFFGVWGMQTFTWCISHHKIFPYQMALIGTPRLDILKKKDINKKSARDYLGIENDCKLLLFCPSVREHDENFILKKIQNLINENKFNFKIKILYKNHINKPNEFKGDYEIIRKMKDEFKDIIFYSTIKKNFKYKLSNLEEYAYFYAACDATISPFSTMSLEGMLKGKPALLYDYDIDAKNITNLKMNLIRHRIYHYPIRLSEGSIICSSKENIIDDINKLLLLTEDNNIVDICKQTANQSINFFGNKTSAERIINCIEDIHEKNELDGSSEIYI